MEHSDYEFDRAKFDAVWRRVMPETAGIVPKQKATGKPPPAEDAGRLREFMDDEACDAQIYCTLASMCSGKTRQALSRISADERCHLKRLRAKYFILTGETYAPPNTCPLIYTVPETLRFKYSGEKEGSAAYKAAAELTSDAELRDTYLAHAEDETRHSRIIGCIIQNMF